MRNSTSIDERALRSSESFGCWGRGRFGDEKVRIDGARLPATTFLATGSGTLGSTMN